MAALAGAACLALIIGIALWVVSVIARGGLIAGVQQVEDEGDTSFGQAWRAGASRFWTLFGIGILAAIPMIILVLLGIAVLVLMFVGRAVGVRTRPRRWARIGHSGADPAAVAPFAAG